MIFASPRFFLFLTTVLCVLAALPSTLARKRFLAFASAFFYAAWDWRYLGLLVAVSAIDYWAALGIVRTSRQRGRRAWLLVSIVSNLGLLAWFKYYNFFVGNWNGLLGGLGLTIPALNILLPAGISFYTFKTMSYTIDVYRGELVPCRSWIDYATFVSFFPELIAGPIVRASIFLPQMDRRIGPTWNRLAVGGGIFLQGLAKKSLFADRLATVADPVFNDPGLFSSATVWCGLLAYSLQIYLDFSGYSDMAIGTARMIGYDLPENFNMPYWASNITDFWRRWHMTLSSWLRDYLYIPLGGSKNGRGRTYVNLMATMLLGGLWHGASWNFVLWGGLHGGALAAHKGFLSARGGRPALHPWIGRILTFLFVTLAWVPFRAAKWSDTKIILGKLIGLGSFGAVWWPFWLFVGLGATLLAHLVGAWLAGARAAEGRAPARELPGGFMYQDLGIPGPYLLSSRLSAVQVFVWLYLFVLIFYLAPARTSPFIYFQF